LSLSIVSRPTSVYRHNAGHWFKAYVITCASANLGNNLDASRSNSALSRSKIGTASVWRIARRPASPKGRARSSTSYTRLIISRINEASAGDDDRASKSFRRACAQQATSRILPSEPV
jgi:hypothetical protein